MKYLLFLSFILSCCTMNAFTSQPYKPQPYNDGLGYIITSTRNGDYVSGPCGYQGLGSYTTNNTYTYRDWNNYSYEQPDQKYIWQSSNDYSFGFDD